MPRKTTLKPHKLSFLEKTIKDYIEIPHKVNKKRIALESSQELELLYCQWLLRAIRVEQDKSAKQEMENRLDISLTNLKANWNKASVTVDKSNLSNIVITINIFASEQEIKQGIDNIMSELLCNRIMLLGESPELFPKELQIKQGTDAVKIINSLREILEWYDQHGHKDIYSIVKDMYNEEATRDDLFNKKKQVPYERQRQAETCLNAARLGTFPPTNLTRARSKRPPKK
jgi:hypothetical protein